MEESGQISSSDYSDYKEETNYKDSSYFGNMQGSQNASYVDHTKSMQTSSGVGGGLAKKNMRGSMEFDGFIGDSQYD